MKLASKENPDFYWSSWTETGKQVESVVGDWRLSMEVGRIKRVRAVCGGIQTGDAMGYYFNFRLLRWLRSNESPSPAFRGMIQREAVNKLNSMLAASERSDLRMSQSNYCAWDQGRCNNDGKGLDLENGRLKRTLRIFEIFLRDSGVDQYPLVSQLTEAQYQTWLNSDDRDFPPYEEPVRAAPPVAPISSEPIPNDPPQVEVHPTRSGPHGGGLPTPEPAGAKVETSSLPRVWPAGELREIELQELLREVSERNYRVYVIVGPKGRGKSALVCTLLNRLEAVRFPGFDYVYGYSFHNQEHDGGRVTSSDGFFIDFASFLGLPPSQNWRERCQQVIERLRQVSCLLVLDGLEPFMGDVARDATHSPIPNPALWMLLNSLVHEQAGFCLATSRYGVTGLLERVGAVQRTLEPFSPSKGKDFYREQRGLVDRMDPDDTPLDSGSSPTLTPPAVCSDLEMNGRTSAIGGGEPLKIQLMARSRKSLAALQEEFHALHTVENRSDPPDFKMILAAVMDDRSDDQLPRAIMELISIHEQKVTRWAVVTLFLEGMPELGITEPITQADLDSAIDDLRRRGLLYPPGRDPHVYEAHPEILRFFRDELEARGEATSRALHGRLYTFYLWALPDEAKSKDDVFGLLAAFKHACLAGRYVEALSEAQQRLAQGRQLYFASRLGCIEAFLETLSLGYSHPYRELKPDVDTMLHGEVYELTGYALSTQGRLLEACTPLERSIRSFRNDDNPVRACIATFTLGETYLSMGELALLKQTLEEARSICKVNAAPRPEKELMNACTLGLEAFLAHSRGDLEGSRKAFQNADALLEDWGRGEPELKDSYLKNFAPFFATLYYRYYELMADMSLLVPLRAGVAETLELSRVHSWPDYLNEVICLPLRRAELEVGLRRRPANDPEVRKIIQQMYDDLGRVIQANLTLPILRVRLGLARAHLFLDSPENLVCGGQLLSEIRSIAPRGRMWYYALQSCQLERHLSLRERAWHIRPAHGTDASPQQWARRAHRIEARTGLQLYLPAWLR